MITPDIKKEDIFQRIDILEEQVKALQESHNSFVQHYHEFVIATVQTLKEISEEEQLLKTVYAQIFFEGNF